VRRLLADACFADVTVDAEVHISADPSLARTLTLLDQAESDLAGSGQIAVRRLDEWRARVDSDAAKGRFTASLTLFVARGRVPTP
jgi:hypothetical protein